LPDSLDRTTASVATYARIGPPACALPSRVGLRNPRLLLRLAWIAAASVASSGCLLESASGPDLGGLYSNSARYHGVERNPIIVIPGILGSRLIDRDSGAVVWGVSSGNFADPTTAAGARLVSLPLHAGDDVNDVLDAVEPAGALDRLQLELFGIPLEIAAYRNILAILGASGYRDQSLGIAGAVDYGDDHFTCFQFAYDWRLDNAENARRLEAFIREKQGYVQGEIERRYGVAAAEVRFDIVAHSMGGLLTRYFLRYGGRNLPADGSLPPLDWSGAKFVDRAVLIGTPNAGSVLAFAQLLNGRKLGPFQPRYSPAVLGTMPSIYQLLPRGRHGTVSDAVSHEAFPDLFSFELWQRMGWGLAGADIDEQLRWLLPEVADREQRRVLALQRLRTSLARAQQFTAAIDVPAAPPPGLELHLFAGDAEPTAAAITVHSRDGAIEVEHFAPGDGTVTRASALMDERLDGTSAPQLRTPIDWTSVTFLFADHLGLTRQPELSDNLLYLLLEAPRRYPRGRRGNSAQDSLVESL